MNLLHEFKEFALRGNVVDLAVGVIIGSAFSNLVNSIVKDLIMPIAGLAIGGFDFSQQFIRLGKIPAAFKGNPHSYQDLQAAGVAVFGYGSFITVLINFFILTFIIFLMVKSINSLRRLKLAANALTHESTSPTSSTPKDTLEETHENTLLLRDIRDALKSSLARGDRTEDK